jgi:hypothetical protein
MVIGDFVNETKQEVEDAWKWSALRTTKTVTTVDGTSQYAIIDSGDRFKLQDPRRSVYNATDKYYLFQQPAVWMKEQLIINTTTSRPSYFYFEGLDSNGDTNVNFYQTPDAVYTINFNLVVPQDDFSAGAEVILVPVRPVILGAYAKAIAERGEDNGKAGAEAELKYQLSLADAVSIDNSKILGEDTWYNG